MSLMLFILAKGLFRDFILLSKLVEHRAQSPVTNKMSMSISQFSTTQNHKLKLKIEVDILTCNDYGIGHGQLSVMQCFVPAKSSNPSETFLSIVLKVPFTNKMMTAISPHISTLL